MLICKYSQGVVCLFIYQFFFDGLFLSIDFDFNTTPPQPKKSFKRRASKYAMCISVEVWFSLAYFLVFLFDFALPPFIPLSQPHTHLFIFKLGPLGQYNKYLCSKTSILSHLCLRGFEIVQLDGGNEFCSLSNL